MAKHLTINRRYEFLPSSKSSPTRKIYLCRIMPKSLTTMFLHRNNAHTARKRRQITVIKILSNSWDNLSFNTGVQRIVLNSRFVQIYAWLFLLLFSLSISSIK